jgi:hypothetical protein
MCCGKNRATIAQTNTQQAQPTVVAPTLQRTSVAYFEYTGKTAMTVIGPVSGIRYRFDAPGSRIAVDLRDRKSVAAIPQLLQVNSL